MSTFDSEQYKASQRQGWDTVASGWQKWWKTTEAASEKVSKRLIELAAIKEGSRVLDVATGIGEPSITAAQQVGNSGHVLAIDISSQMLSIAKQRAISGLNLPDELNRNGNATSIAQYVKTIYGSELSIIENVLASEITFLFYINLARNRFIDYTDGKLV
ncbi:MAG: class I SAM-dependent methyltransferase [Nitrososphaeraceae archaeon]